MIRVSSVCTGGTLARREKKGLSYVAWWFLYNLESVCLLSCYVYVMYITWCIGGRLRYSRYAVRPYIGGMYHQIYCMSDLGMF